MENSDKNKIKNKKSSTKNDLEYKKVKSKKKIIKKVDITNPKTKNLNNLNKNKNKNDIKKGGMSNIDVKNEFRRIVLQINRNFEDINERFKNYDISIKALNELLDRNINISDKIADNVQLFNKMINEINQKYEIINEKYNAISKNLTGSADAFNS